MVDPPTPVPQKPAYYRDRDRLLWAARRQRETEGAAYRGASARGLAKVFAAAELSLRASDKDRADAIGRIRKAIEKRRDWIELSALTEAAKP